MFQFSRSASTNLWIQFVIIRESRDQHLFDNYPELIAVFHARPRLLMPRHPPCALSSLTRLIQNSIHKIAGGCQQPFKHHPESVSYARSRSRGPGNNDSQYFLSSLKQSCDYLNALTKSHQILKKGPLQPPATTKSPTAESKDPAINTQLQRTARQPFLRRCHLPFHQIVKDHNLQSDRKAKPESQTHRTGKQSGQAASAETQHGEASRPLCF